MTRQEAWELLTEYNKEEFHLEHAEILEKTMMYFAKELGYGDEAEFWGQVGLLHDLDEETCPWREDLSTHGPTSARMLKEAGWDDDVLCNAIMSHNPICGKNPETTLEFAIIAADPMSGFIKAIAQIYPDKKVASVKHKSVSKRFKESRFAAGANRQYMMEIEKTGISFDEFIDIALESMCSVAEATGL
ncbi:MAG: phosphohydrolase [Firmicutes bacterium]|nr:phosphohydrolase [Bacillota bacterium]